MPKYEYIARDQLGRKAAGTLIAKNRQEAGNKLFSKKYTPVSIQLAQAKPFLKKNILSSAIKKKPSLKDKMFLSIHLSYNLESGISLLKALNTILTEISNNYFRDILAKICDDLRSGSSLAESLKKYPSVFDNYFISIVEAGENTGSLGQSFSRLAKDLEAKADFQKNIISALIYPCLLIFGSFALVTFVMVTIVPQFVQIFEQAKASLPMPTLILLTASDFLRYRWHYLLILIVSAVLIYRIYTQTESGRFSLDKLKLRIPLLGPLLKKIYIAHFLRTFGVLYNAGVPVLNSLRIVEESMASTVYKKMIRELSSQVKEGESISRPAKGSELFTPEIEMMISSGEETGKLPEMLGKAASLYEKEVARNLKDFISLFEPLAITLMALLIGFIAFAILFPVFRISQIAL